MIPAKIRKSACLFSLFLFLSGCGISYEQSPSEQKKHETESRATNPSKNDSSDSTSETLSNIPEWYKNRSFESKSDGIKIGYGQGPTRQIAMNQSLDRIAQKLGVTVRSTTEREITSVDQKKEHIQDRFQNQTRLEARHRIKNFENIRTERSNGTFYSAYKVDRRPLPQILADKIRDRLVESRRPLSSIKWDGPGPLIRGDLIQTVEQLVVDDEKGKRSVPIKISLSRSDDQWVLTLGQTITQPLENPDFARLLNWKTETELLKLELIDEKTKSQANRLNKGDRFYFRVKSQDPDGYFALFNLYQDGRLSVLKEATPLDSVQFVPSEKKMEKGERFRASLISPGQSTLDVYLAVSSDQKISTAEFRYLQRGQKKVQANKTFQVHDLLEWLEENPITAIDTINVRTLPVQTSPL